MVVDCAEVGGEGESLSDGGGWWKGGHGLEVLVEILWDVDRPCWKRRRRHAAGCKPWMWLIGCVWRCLMLSCKNLGAES